ncbi:hypothetical protein ETB97_003178 [Aspergillus alliaceus]|uniref:Uncharacterized protein n=1 Tax=Petromyces alliaceus TaxID=209559 RepID=A0A8H6A332_PETAA|nr:hypothetical protein ETB97_003178 [Aspergillus burnettii]
MPIVGAEVGGLVLASHLSEYSNINDFVIEAGSDYIRDPLVGAPDFLGAMIANPDFNRDYLTEPQVHATIFKWVSHGAGWLVVLRS